MLILLQVFGWFLMEIHLAFFQISCNFAGQIYHQFCRLKYQGHDLNLLILLFGHFVSSRGRLHSSFCNVWELLCNPAIHHKYLSHVYNVSYTEHCLYILPITLFIKAFFFSRTSANLCSRTSFHVTAARPFNDEERLLQVC